MQDRYSLHVGDWQRLGRLVGDERARLRLSWAELARYAGIGERTLYKIRHAERSSYDDETLARLESALGWDYGSVQRVLDGREPVRLPDPQLARVLHAWPDLTPAAREAVAATAEAHRRA